MKKQGKWSIVALVAIVVFSVVVPEAWARGGGGGGGRSGGGSSSRSSGSSSRSSNYSKPATAPKATPAPTAPKPPANYTKPAAETAPATKTPVKPADPKAGNPVTTSKSQLPGAVSKQQSKQALDNFKASQQKFTVPPKPTANPTATAGMTDRAKSAGVNTRDDYYVQRDNYWGGRNYTPPAYAYSSPSMFGNFDGLFLWMMLDSIQDAQMMSFYRGNANDPDMKAWREEAQKQAATNAELQTKLTALDAKVAELDQAGEKVEPGFIPPGAEAAVIAASVAEDNLPAAPEEVIAKPITQPQPPQPEDTGWSWGMIIGGGIVIGLVAVFALMGMMS